MALGLSTGTGNGGDFLPRIQYDAKAGRFFRVDREQDASEMWVSNLTEIQLPTMLAIDFEQIEVGWMKFAGGVDFKMAVFGQPMPANPGVLDGQGKPLYKQGFRVRVYEKSLGVRDWNHSAKCVINVVDILHSQFLEQQAANPGMVPIVSIERTVPITTGSGERKSTNYAPVMKIEKWIPLPDAMKAARPGGAPTTNGNGHAAQQDDVPAPMRDPVPPSAAPQANAVGSPDF